jgi:hypothetical protein
MQGGGLSGISPGVEEMMKFHSAFGQFILSFSQSEGMLYSVLVAMTGAPDPIARAIFSGVRARGMCDFIKAILANTQLPNEESPETNTLRKCMEQLLAINTARDQLVHHGMNSFTPDGVTVNNSMRVSRYANFEQYSVNSKELEFMNRDLGYLTSYFFIYGMSLKDSKFKPLEFVPPPWLYKPRQPKSPGQRSSQKTPKRGPRR